MGSGEETAPVKSSKQTASTQEMPTTPSYPDWYTSMQACYGPGATPPPFFTTAGASSPTPHPYLWGSQHFIPQYGSPLPYTAVYPHGGVYPYPNMAVAQGAAPVTTETEGKGSNRKEKIPVKKSKGNSGNSGVVVGKSGEGGKVASGSGNDGASQSPVYSDESGSEGSSDTSDENTNQQEGTKKRSFDQMLADGANAQNNNATQYSGVNCPASVPGKPAVTMPATNLNIAMDLWNAAPAGTVPSKARPNEGVAPTTIVGREGVAPEHLWIQDERELKRQRRKQSNRESARRSRLRKQAECEELQVKVETLSNENESLRTEMNRLSEECSKLKSENTAIKTKLKRLGEADAIEGNHANTFQTVNGEVHNNGQDTSRESNSISGENGNDLNSKGNLQSDPN